MVPRNAVQASTPLPRMARRRERHCPDDPIGRIPSQSSDLSRAAQICPATTVHAESA